MLEQKLGLSIKEAIALSGVRRTAIFLAMKDGKLPARKSGRRTIILRSDLIKYLECLPLREVA